VSALRLVLRQIRADRYAAALLAGVLAFGAFLGATAPRWIDARLDAALRQVVDESGRGGELVARETTSATPEALDRSIPRLRRTEPLVAQLYDEGRWAVSTGDTDVITHNGEPESTVAPRVISLRMPQQFADRVRLVEGELPSGEVETADSPEGRMPVVGVVTTPEVALALRLEIGHEVLASRTSALPVEAGSINDSAERLVTFRLIGLVEPVDPGWPGWTDAGTAIVPGVDPPGTEPRFTRATVLTDPAAMEGMISVSRSFLQAEWHLDPVPGAFDSEDVAELTTSLHRIQTGSVPWQTSMDDLLDDYSASRASAERVSALGIASLAGLLLALLLLAVRLVAERRADALRLTRTRGGGDGLLARLLAAEGLLVGLSAVGVGTAAAMVLVEGSGGTTPYVIPAALLLVTVVALPVIGVRLARQAATDRPEIEALRPSPRRLVLEGGAVVVAAIVLWVMSTRTSGGGGGIDPLVSSAPVLAGAAAGLVTFRVLPYAIAAVARVTGRGRSATTFLATARAARSPGPAVLPVVALLVAVGLAAFGGVVGTTAERAQQMSSWNAVPADVVVETATLRVATDDLDGLVPDATTVAAGYVLPSQRAADSLGRTLGVDVMAVDVDAWQGVTAAAPEQVDVVSALATASPRDAVPGVLKGNRHGFDVGERVTFDLREGEVVVEIVDRVQDFAGAPSDSVVVLPSQPLAATLEGRWPSVFYLAGELEGDEVAAAFDGDVTMRADVLAAIGEAPVLASTLDLFRVAFVAAAVLAGAAAVLGLLITSRSRSYSLSILRTLGLTTRQATALVAAEVVPSSVAAAVVGAGVGLGVALIATRALDLSTLTGLVEGGRAVVLDVPGTALAAAGVLGVVLASVVLTVIASRRARLGAVLRAGDPR
jgi:putative ABC transport system permease protein